LRQGKGRAEAGERPLRQTSSGNKTRIERSKVGYGTCQKNLGQISHGIRGWNEVTGGGEKEFHVRARLSRTIEGGEKCSGGYKRERDEREVGRSEKRRGKIGVIHYSVIA